MYLLLLLLLLSLLICIMFLFFTLSNDFACVFYCNCFSLFFLGFLFFLVPFFVSLSILVPYFWSVIGVFGLHIHAFISVIIIIYLFIYCVLYMCRVINYTI
jgi:hypothetical protein